MPRPLNSLAFAEEARPEIERLNRIVKDIEEKARLLSSPSLVSSLSRFPRTQSGVTQIPMGKLQGEFEVDPSPKVPEALNLGSRDRRWGGAFVKDFDITGVITGGLAHSGVNGGPDIGSTSAWWGNTHVNTLHLFEGDTDVVGNVFSHASDVAGNFGFTFHDLVDQRIVGSYIFGFVGDADLAINNPFPWSLRMQSAITPKLIIGKPGFDDSAWVSQNAFAVGDSADAPGIFPALRVGTAPAGQGFTAASHLQFTAAGFTPKTGAALNERRIKFLNASPDNPLGSVEDVFQFEKSIAFAAASINRLLRFRVVSTDLALLNQAGRWGTFAEKFGMYKATNSRWTTIDAAPGGVGFEGTDRGTTEPLI